MPLMIVSHGDVFTLQGTEGYGRDVFIAEDGDQGPGDIKPGTTHAKIVSVRIFARLTRSKRSSKCCAHTPPTNTGR